MPRESLLLLAPRHDRSHNPKYAGNNCNCRAQPGCYTCYIIDNPRQSESKQKNTPNHKLRDPNELKCPPENRCKVVSKTVFIIGPEGPYDCRENYSRYC